jgi:CheY-like chemotaxis protein
MADSRVRCLSVGMDDCVTKPFRRAEPEAMRTRWAPRTRSAPAPVA